MKSLKNTVKKMAALTMGTSMVAATILGATAQAYDLGDYPMPFVQDGQFDGLLVVGDDAAPADIIGITDIAIALQFSSTTTEVVNVGGQGGVSVEGDSVEISDSSDMLEINERIGAVRETITGDELEALSSGTITTDKGTTDYNQYVRLEDSTNEALTTKTDEDFFIPSGKVVYQEDDDDNVGDFLLFNDGDVMFEYHLEFEEGLESDLEGTAPGFDLDDLEDEVLNILGRQYAVVEAETFNSDAGIRLTLLGGDVTDTLEEGQTKTYTIDGVDFEVTAVIIADSGNANTDYVKLKVNGEVTDKMAEGETDKLSDGTEIGIRDVLANEAGETAGGDIVEFYLGASKLVVEDSNVSDTTFDTGIEISEETENSVYVQIKGEIDTADTNAKINSIKLRVEADSSSNDDLFIPAGSSVREFLENPGVLLSESFDIRYEGLMDTGVSLIELDPQGDEGYNLRFENRAGKMYNIPLVDNSEDTFILGEDKGTAGADASDELLIFTEGTDIKEDDSFVLSAAPNDDTAFSYIYTFDDLDSSDKILTFSDASTGGQKEVSYTGTAPTAIGDLVVGGKTFRVTVLNTTSGSEAIEVDLDSSGTVGTNDVKITTQGGAILAFVGNVSATTGVITGDLNITVTTEADNFDGTGPILTNGTVLAGPEVFTLNIDGDTANEVRAYVLQDNLFTLAQHEENDDLETAMTPYGAMISIEGDTTDADAVKIEYPTSGQRGAQVFVTAGTVSTSSSAAGTVTIEKPNRIDVGASLLASQVSSTAANIISVGGPCVNAVSAEVMGLSYPACGDASGLGPNEAMIKLYESGANVAVVVAGYNAADTTAATRVLADFEAYQASGELAGAEVKLSVTNPSSFTVTPVNG